MFWNRTVAGVAMLFAAVIVAHPGPSFAASHVDAAMGVMPSIPAGMGTNLQGGGNVGMEKSDEDDERSAKGVVMGNMPPSIAPADKMPPSIAPAAMMPPSIAPAGKVSQGLKGPPAAHKVMPYKALQK